MVAQKTNIILRVLEWIWAIIIMGMVGNMIDLAYAGNPPAINYAMFTVAFAMFTLFYLTPVAFSEGIAGHMMIPLVLDVLNVIFFFISAVVLSHDLHVHSCTNRSYIDNNSITNGAYNRPKRCREAQASTAFLWFAFATFCGSMVISIFNLRGGANMRSGGIRKGGPSMSQV